MSSITDQIPAAFADSDDRVLPFQIDGLDVRGRTVHLGPSLDRILERHDYPEPVSRLLAEAILLASLLGSSLKFDGRFILQTRTDGAVSLIVVEYRTPDAIRATARFDAKAVEEAQARGEAGPEQLLGRGNLAMTVDQGSDMDRYQGIVALDGAGFEEIAHRYFMQSEQIPSRVRLAVGEVLSKTGDGAKHTWRGGGILIQFLPEAGERVKQRDLPSGGPDDADPEPDDDAWAEAQSLLETLEDFELTDPAITAERLLYRLFHERGVRVFDGQTLNDRCSCTRQRVSGMLAGFTDEERQSLVVDGNITVTCEFCGLHYHFTENEFPAD